jgi:hypothetical protein
MTPLPVWVVGGTLAAAAVFAIVLDFVKVPVSDGSASLSPQYVGEREGSPSR